MSSFLSYIVVFAAGVLAGAAVMFFVMRNNKKLANATITTSPPATKP